MSDKNPYYSIPKALGEPTEEISLLPVDPALIELRDLYEQFRRDVHATLNGKRAPGQNVDNR